MFVLHGRHVLRVKVADAVKRCTDTEMGNGQLFTGISQAKIWHWECIRQKKSVTRHPGRQNYNGRERKRNVKRLNSASLNTLKSESKQ